MHYNLKHKTSCLIKINSENIIYFTLPFDKRLHKFLTISGDYRRSYWKPIIYYNNKIIKLCLNLRKYYKNYSVWIATINKIQYKRR